MEHKEKERRLEAQPLSPFQSPANKTKGKRSEASVSSPLASPWRCTETCSIVEAILQQRRRRQDYMGDSFSQPPIDIVAVVLDVSVNLALQTAELFVTDPSLPNASHCARIKLKGHAVVSPILERNIARADIVRMNRLEVRNDNYVEPSKAAASGSGNASQQLKIVCDLCHSWKQPEAGVLWKRLCCIRDGQIVATQEPLPDNMATPPSKIQALAKWFSQQQKPPSIPSIHSRSVKRRRLSEISTAGLVSHVAVQILSCDHSSVDAVQYKKRKRFKSCADHAPCIVAMLSDGSRDEDVMALHDCKLSWEVPLKRFMSEKERVRITNLQSVVSNGHVVLVPTLESLVIRIGNETHNSGNNFTSGHSSELASQMETQQPLVPLHEQDTVSVVSPLVDVYVDSLDVSLGEGEHWSTPQDLCSVLIDSGEKKGPLRYRPGTLTLKDSSGLFAVRADHSIVETLCGSLEAELVIQREDLCTHMLELLRGLLEEAVPLEWTLTRKSARESYTVVSVRLPRL